ncbi:MAG: acyltransferase, partial [Cyanobacteria bacterium P01_A01_bin.80]
KNINNSKQTRLFIFDLLKALSIVAVVSYHSIFVPQSTYTPHIQTLEILFSPLRFCVPIFLTISFFLLERHLDIYKDQSLKLLLKKRMNRLLIPTCFWFAIAFILKLCNGKSIGSLIPTISQGTIFTGSYYLLIILQLIPLFICCRKWFKKDKNLYTTILLQGLIFLSLYILSFAPVGQKYIEFLKIIDRPLIIYWFVYIALGILIYRNFAWIKQKSINLKIYQKLFLILINVTTFMVEYQLILKTHSNSIQPFDYASFSCILSIPTTFLCCSSLTSDFFWKPLNKLIKLLSVYSLGIFCINGIISQIFLSLGDKLISQHSFSLIEILTIKILGWIILLSVSLGLSIILKNLGLKRVVC